MVRLEAAGQIQTKPVLSQSSYVSQNDLRLHFGLGRATRVDRMTVRGPPGWPRNSQARQPTHFCCWSKEAEWQSRYRRPNNGRD